MKAIIKYRISLFALFTALFASSCNKLVEIPPSPIDKVSPDRVYSDSINVLAALVGIYTNFKTGGSDGSINSRYLTVYAGLSADELKSPDANQTDLYNNELTPEDASVNQLWVSAYASLYHINDFLQRSGESTGISGSYKNQVTGEALVCRALQYFQLVNLFGDVPIITSTDYKSNASVGRSSVDSVYGLIISDLTKAVQLLKPDYPSAGRARPNVNAAKALLAKVYLYRKQWAEAADLSNQVIKSGLYDLVAPASAFISGSREAIWQLPTASSWNQTGEGYYFVPYSDAYIPSYILPDDLLNAFEPNDKRKTTWIKTNVVNGVSYPYPYKYKNTSNTGTPVEDYMMLRIGDQYLIRSEALAHLNLLDSARSGINQVRNRAGLGVTPAVTQPEILTAIEQERRVELFAERGNRWFDLKRTDRANAVLSPKKPMWQTTDVLYPIPQQQRRTNLSLTQNLGYN